MAWSCNWPAPAKLNLFLHITGRRADGYHDVQTVFQLLDTGDELDFQLTDDGQLGLSCDIAALESDDNLVLRAARALRAHAPGRAGAQIRLRKRLPAGGGVGGGSSDAATTLLALNALWDCGVALDELASIGRALGADVPVFVRGRTAFGQGIGDLLQPIDTGARSYLVLHAGVAIETAPLFASKQLTRDCGPIKIEDFAEGKGSNVFEPLVRDRYPDIDSGMRWLDDQGALFKSRLTGTGGCFFAVFDDCSKANSVLASAPHPLSGFVAQGTASSLAHDRLELHGVQ